MVKTQHETNQAIWCRPDRINRHHVCALRSDPARDEIVRRLAKERRPITCGELDIDRPKSTMPHHFEIIRESGIVHTKVEGKEHYNSLRSAEIEKISPGIMKTLLTAIKKSPGLNS